MKEGKTYLLEVTYKRFSIIIKYQKHFVAFLHYAQT